MLAFTANPSRDREVSVLPYTEVAAILAAQTEQVGGGVVVVCQLLFIGL